MSRASGAAIALLAVLTGLWTTPAAALRLVTWNLSWLTERADDINRHFDNNPRSDQAVFARSSEDFARLKGYADRLDGDIVAFQEVDGPDVAAKVFDPARYVLYFSHGSEYQRPGFAVRRNLHVTANADLASLNIYGPIADSLRAGADITLDYHGETIRLLAVHLKSGCATGYIPDDPQGPVDHSDPCGVLARQLPILQDWIDRRHAEGRPFIILGDFNRRFVSRDGRATDWFWRHLAGNPTRGLTLADAAVKPLCWGEDRPLIDHIVLSRTLGSWLVPGSVAEIGYRETDRYRFEPRLSDHCPLGATLLAPNER
ncbi:MAG: endonuclease/exonuclease/phosphatase family protein [Azospirillaceae bacterium]|nr:endonuclease/exonuclease/phosphatase family protein [Azospirillaceae bacterium]